MAEAAEESAAGKNQDRATGACKQKFELCRRGILADKNKEKRLFAVDENMKITRSAKPKRTSARPPGESRFSTARKPKYREPSMGMVPRRVYDFGDGRRVSKSYGLNKEPKFLTYEKELRKTRPSTPEEIQKWKNKFE